MFVKRLLRRLNEERSQLIIFFVGLFTIITVVGVITIDFGLWFSERQGVQRAADLAALAGSQSLLRHASQPAGRTADQTTAINDACLWAARNGYEHGQQNVEVYAQLFCRNTNTAFHDAGMCLNTNPSAGPSACGYQYPQECSTVLGSHPQVTDDGCDTISVTISKSATHLFSSIFDIPGNMVGFGSQAGEYSQAIPIQAIMTIDRTGSMDGNPLNQAKIAATNFTDFLLPTATGSSQNLVGMVPYNECYRPPLSSNSHCTLTSWIADLTNNRSTVDGKINSLTADWGTNICLGIDRANTLLPTLPAGSITHQALVLLSDGQNQYSEDSYGQGQPPVECRPSHPADTDPQTGLGCFSAQPNQRDLDRETNTLVNGPGGLKDRGIDVYVVGFSVCGTSTTDPHYNDVCDPNMIDTNTHDNSANRNLLKCLASSTPGTNDHYYEVPNASDLPNIFQAIAWAITGRSLTQ